MCPFALFWFGASLPETKYSREKGTLITKGSLENLGFWGFMGFLGLYLRISGFILGFKGLDFGFRVLGDYFGV